MQTEKSRAEERFRLVVEAAPSAMLMIDEGGLITLVNDQLEQLFGYDRVELLGREVEELVPERFRSAHPGHRTDFFLRPVSRPMGAGRDLFGLRKDGREVPIEIGLNPIDTEEGRMVLASIIDITERKRAEEQFRLVVEAAPSAMLMVDEQGLITLVNGQTERLFGYARAELLGEPIEMLVPERFRAEHPGHRGRFLQNPEARPMGAGRDLFGLRKDGQEVPIEIGLNPLQTDQGHMVLASIIDITERKQAAQQLESSLREKEVLLREIHHRVKNNLAVIGSLFYLQSKATEDEQTLQTLKDCQHRVRSMALVHEWLYRSEDLAAVDFGEYTRELARELFHSYSLSGDSIGLKLDLEPMPLRIDWAIPCGLILTELLANALKHAFPRDRAGEIRVSLGRTGDQGLVLCVADNGIGLPDDDTQHGENSLGMRLVDLLAKQIDAQIEFVRLDPGTEAHLILEAKDDDIPR